MSDSRSDRLNSAKRRYWKANLIVIALLLAVWLVASCCCGILFIEPLNEFSIGKLPLGDRAVRLEHARLDEVFQFVVGAIL